jgi:DNA polymerase-3 subunit beta
MKIVCHKSVLATAVGLVQSVVSSKNTLPILNNLLIETAEKGVNILGTDLEIGLRSKVEVEVLKPGSITLPAKKLSELIREVPQEEIELSVEGTKVSLKSGKFHSQLMGLGREDFPSLPELKAEKGLEIKDQDLQGMIRKVIFSVSNDETRRVLNGALFSVQGKEVSMVSTDGHRLSMVRKVLDKNVDRASAIVPTKALMELERLLDGSESTLKVFFSENHLFFEKGPNLLVTRLIDGQFPNFEQVIPKKQDSILVTDTESLLKATRRVSLMASDKSNSIKFTLGKDVLTIASNTPDLGEAEEEIEVSYQGAPMTVAYNARYILEVLKVMDAAKTEFKLTTPLNPGLVTPQGGDGSSQYVIMPMRV